MARTTSRRNRQEYRDDVQQQRETFKVFLAFVTLFIATIIGYMVKNYGYLTLDWSTKRLDDNDPLVKMLYDDLDSAKQPFNRSEFNLDQIFGSKPIWGSLNSGHYFGLKLSTPQTIETSLLWFKNQLNPQGRLDMRHLCNQNDRLRFYAWTNHDFWTFGQQTIQDDVYNLYTSYVIDKENPLNWQAKITVDSGSFTVPISLIQYITTNTKTDTLNLNPVVSKSRQNDDLLFKISGISKDLGDFEFDLGTYQENRPIRSSYIVGNVDKYLPIATYLHSKMTVATHNGSRIFELPSRKDVGVDQRTNLIAIQFIFMKPGSITLNFKQVISHDDRQSKFDLENYDLKLSSKIKEFEERITQKYYLSDSEKRSSALLAHVALGNMIGGIGYFYGYSLIGSSVRQDKVMPYGPIQLLTAVPSRSFFPRGFLWDEGFHNLLISDWDPKLANLIIVSWFDIMNNNGWIPREVILGLESMRRVPEEFIVQRIANANPPAMFLVIERMLEAETLTDHSLKQIYPKLKQWFSWFDLTQFGPKTATYRWRGRDELSVNMLNPKTLTSGFDDYPRASHPSPLEYHIDLRCWMTLACRTLSKLASKMGDFEYQESISGASLVLNDNQLLDELHWSDENQMYCDFGLNTQNIELVWVTKTRRSQHDGQIESYRALERHSIGQPQMGCVPEFGYVSLFPMIMKILSPYNEKLVIILNRLRDENELWTPYGIRSLSKSSKYYRKYNTEHDKPYWRGPIWVNLNYLILSSLEYYSRQEGPYRERFVIIFEELKENLVSNIHKEFARTNYLWENYDDITGEGQGSHPFTGWSSLVLLIMASEL